MTDSIAAPWIYLGAITSVTALVIIGARLWPAPTFDDEAYRRDIPLPDAELARQIIHYRRGVRTLSFALWWVVMAVVGTPVFDRAGADGPAPTGTVIAVLAIAAVFVGEALSRAVLRPFSPHASSVRLTRDRTVTTSMFVSRRAWIIPRVAVAVAIVVGVAAITAAVLARRHDLLLATGVISVVLVVVLVAMTVLQHVIVTRPQPVGSLTELAWDDALRADALAAARSALAILTIAAVEGFAVIVFGAVTGIVRPWEAVITGDADWIVIACVAVVVVMQPWRPTSVPAALRKTLA